MTNIAELLKDAPKGIKLYSPLFGEVEYSYIGGTNRRIWVCTKASMRMFSMDGRYCFTHDGNTIESTECLLFPSKDCRTWEGWKLPVEHCFKVGDKIEATIYGIKRRVTIREVDKTNRCYFGTLEECIGFSEQDQWHLAPKKHYDIANFKPFDKVLGRISNINEWRADYFSHLHKSGDIFAGIGHSWFQCIPFNEDTEHLLGTTDMPSEEYINW